MSRTLIIVSFCLLAVLACSMPVQAATVFWTNTDAVNGGDFCDPANWNTGTFPGIADDASLQNSNTIVPPITDPPVTTHTWYPTYLGATAPANAINNLWIGNTNEGTVGKGGGWLIQTAQTLNVNEEVVIARGWDAVQPVDTSEYEITGTGVLNLTPAAAPVTTGECAVRVSTSVDLIAIMKISDNATVNVNPTSGLGMFYVGDRWGGTGIVRQSGTSTVNIKSALILGRYDTSSCGYYNLSGGNLNIGSAGQETAIGSNGHGLFEMSGGNVYVATRTQLGKINTDVYGVINISGGTYWNNGASTNEVGDAGMGIINISGTGVYHTNSDIYLGYARDGIHRGSGIINVKTGGTLETTGLLKGMKGRVAEFNFHGGTLKTLKSTYNFFNDSGFADQTPAVASYVYPEGGIIDTSGQAGNTTGTTVLVATPLAAPTGKGLTSVTFDYYQWQNWSYFSPPIVKITPAAGDSTGEGATAYAVLDTDPNNKYRIKEIVITNPGVNYTLPPVITLVGGKYQNNGQIVTTTTIGDNSDTGGITKKGLGILALSAVNTYAGDTTIEAGTLALIDDGQLNPTSNIINNADFAVATVFGGGGVTHTVGNITGTGNTTVYDNSILNAKSIVQDTLTIGGAISLPAASAVPEPSSIVLLTLAGLGLLLAFKRRK